MDQELSEISAAFGVEPKGQQSGVEMLLVDSGAGRTVLKHDAFGEQPLEQSGSGVVLRGIGGQELQQYGKRKARVMLPSGQEARLEGTVAGVVRNALSVARAADQGPSFVFSPSGGYLTRREPQRPDDAEDFVREGGLYYLAVRAAPEAGAAGAGSEVVAPMAEEPRPAGLAEDEAMFEPLYQDLEELREA